MLDANMLKKDHTDIVKPLEVNDDELLQVHTQEYMSNMRVSCCLVTNIKNHLTT